MTYICSPVITFQIGVSFMPTTTACGPNITYAVPTDAKCKVGKSAASSQRCHFHLSMKGPQAQRAIHGCVKYEMPELLHACSAFSTSTALPLNAGSILFSVYTVYSVCTGWPIAYVTTNVDQDILHCTLIPVLGPSGHTCTQNSL